MGIVSSIGIFLRFWKKWVYKIYQFLQMGQRVYTQKNGNIQKNQCNHADSLKK